MKQIGRRPQPVACGGHISVQPQEGLSSLQASAQSLSLAHRGKVLYIFNHTLILFSFFFMKFKMPIAETGFPYILFNKWTNI